ncbi:hypothetical protein EXIGLDRAFT_733814 [Exidia glandulosa HHB12029]|uniref:F-box domain-containing protein n=1 Tax=Exidia glandulosa HHB12029 TaxID=1314781 RepID=A0A165B7H5_EXIGL|nr:hypothetical protein EXIGLDRAFT_733814 [Exidia glandulosa HHB12029]
MAKQKQPQRPARPVSRPLTRQTFHELASWAQQFAHLPLELARMIIAVTARLNVASNAAWVARSLSLVCREFRAVVEPILLETMRITATNADFFRYKDPWQLDRFTKRIKRLVVDGPPFMAFNLHFFAAVQAFKGRPRHLDMFVRACGTRFQPRVVTIQNAAFMSDLEDSTWNALQTLECTTHLHMQECTPQHLMHLRNNLPPGVRYLVLDPSGHHSTSVEELVALVYTFLDESAPSSIERLLVRTPYLSDERRTALVHALGTLAAATGERRLCVDDELLLVRGKHGPVRQRIADEEARVSLWFTGHPLYTESDLALPAVVS